MKQIDFKAFPKVALHDHLDGGVRPSTLLELACAQGIALPADTPEQLALEVAKRVNSGSLVSYLEAFDWTVPVMQTADALTRIAREAVEDLAEDGVVLAEIRFAPLLHTAGGLSAQQVIDAVSAGLRQGTELTGMPAGLILCGIRCKDEFGEVARLFRENYHPHSVVVGVDLAGPELGFPVSKHPAIAALAAEIPDAPITLHAGEVKGGAEHETDGVSAGVASIREAIRAGARRVGHCTCLIEDILGDRALLQEILERDILVEVCLTSNGQTLAVENVASHPLPRFLAERVKATLDVDNRMVSATSYSAEYQLAYEVLRISEEALLQMSRNGLQASFLPQAQKQAVIRKYPELA